MVHLSGGDVRSWIVSATVRQTSHNSIWSSCSHCLGGGVIPNLAFASPRAGCRSRSWLVGVQVYRVLGVIFLVLYAGGHLPGVFALPAGVGDTLVGILAPFVAASFARSAEGSERRVRIWNLLGIADLVIAVTLGFLTSPSPFQVAAFDRPSALIAMFPLSLIPVFAVPLSILLHIAITAEVVAAPGNPHQKADTRCCVLG
jgi:hypothetical protein